MAQIPDIDLPQFITNTAVQAVNTVIQDAVRLGISWRLRPGTVAGDGYANPASVPVVVDGDNAQLYARSMVGLIQAGDRVWCIQVPPAGVYVVGVMATTQQLVQSGTVVVTPSTEVLPAASIYDGSYWHGNTSVNFGTAYDSAPHITVSAFSTVPGTVIEASHSAVTATGFTARVARANTTATTLHWIAVGTVSPS